MKLNWSIIIFLLFDFTTILESESDTHDDQYDFEPISERDGTKASDEVLEQIRFYVNSTHFKGGSHEIKIGRFNTLTKARLNKSAHFKILIHGFMGNCAGESFPNRIINAYRQKNSSSQFNLLCVDWGPLSNQGGELSMHLYRVAIRNAIFVGKRIAEFIKYLMDKKMVMSLRHIHLIGFSLGAHVAGTTGYFVERFYHRKIGRITGLDPAGPYFDEQTPVERKLDQTDAKFVDVIHTNAGQLGIFKSLGHVDFYPNGGRQQPQCDDTGDPLIDFQEAISGVCSHHMAPKYFALSIIEPTRIACKCVSWKAYMNANCACRESTIFGENCKLSSRGDYYLIIRKEVGKSDTDADADLYSSKSDEMSSGSEESEEMESEFNTTITQLITHTINRHN